MVVAPGLPSLLFVDMKFVLKPLDWIKIRVEAPLQSVCKGTEKESQLDTLEHSLFELEGCEYERQTVVMYSNPF